MLKQLSIAALAGLAFAQDNNRDLTAALDSSNELSTLKSLLPQNVLNTLNSANNITILAPSNSAFESVGREQLVALSSDSDRLAALLQYHVLNGSYKASDVPDDNGAFIHTLLTNNAFTNVTDGQVVQAVSKDDKVIFYSGMRKNSTVTSADVEFSGGVIHIIDRLLTIPEQISQITQTGGLDSLRGGLVEADLLDTVNTESDLTVFAPTNDAFRNIGSGLGSLSKEDLTNILTYHVVAGTVAYSPTLTNGTSIATLNGKNVTITVGDDGIFVNNAKVVLANVLAANGVVHVIDEVLNPNNEIIVDANNQDDGESAYENATPVENAPWTSGQPQPTATLPGFPPQDGPAEAESSNAAPMPNAAIGMAALFGAVAAIYLV